MRIPGLWYRKPSLYWKLKWLKFTYKHGSKNRQSAPCEGYVNGTKFVFEFPLGNNYKKMYYGIYEYGVREVLKKYLKPGGVFIDIGANVGYVTAFAMGLIGTKGAVHCFEPIPDYYQRLLRIGQMNPTFNFTANNMAVGEFDGQVQITKHKAGMGSSSIIPGFFPEQYAEKTLPVKITRLDTYLAKNNISEVSVIKIDTEGFELPVLLGASGFFEKCKAQRKLPVIIAEITPEAFKLMGKNIKELADFMKSCGYKSYDVLDRYEVDMTKMNTGEDILFRA